MHLLANPYLYTCQSPDKDEANSCKEKHEEQSGAASTLKALLDYRLLTQNAL